MTLTVEADSTVSVTNVKGVCPSVGEAWITLTPAGTAATVFAKGEEASTAMADDMAKDKTGLKMYREAQICNKAVASDADLTGVICAFSTGSALTYEARLYCSSTEGFFYASSAGTEVVAVSNGGKVIKTTLTYTKKIDVVTDNAVVNTLLCKMAQ